MPMCAHTLMMEGRKCMKEEKKMKAEIEGRK
jgi:hypothetical protein